VSGVLAAIVFVALVSQILFVAYCPVPATPARHPAPSRNDRSSTRARAVWGTLCVVTTGIAVVLLASVQRERDLSS
jgi:hypothetical protein